MAIETLPGGSAAFALRPASTDSMNTPGATGIRLRPLGPVCALISIGIRFGVPLTIMR